MKKNEVVVQKDYPYRIAGRVWSIPTIHFTKSPDGTLGLSTREIERIHKAIANEICGEAVPLTGEEVEFLAGASGLSFSEVAEKCGFNRANISYWRKRGAVNEKDSFRLKRFFWVQLFADDIRFLSALNVRFLSDERSLLSELRARAIDEKAAFEVKLARAS